MTTLAEAWAPFIAEARKMRQFRDGLDRRHVLSAWETKRRAH